MAGEQAAYGQTYGKDHHEFVTIVTKMAITISI